MGEHKYKYEIQLDEKDKQNVIKGLFKILDEKALGIKELCADGRISGAVYDCELEALSIALMDIENIKDTLYLFKNIKEVDNK